ncbi:MAG TPA: LacI family DNA-binding transcriptional regulator [Chloroflexota bacterium]
MPTIQDVAREAGVGVGTVSRVLGGGRLVSPTTRGRVDAAVERLGYRANPVARALRRGRTQTLAVVVPLSTPYFFIEVLRGVEAALGPTDHALVLRTVERAADRDRAFLDPGAAGRAEGVLIVSLTPTRGQAARLRAAGRPVALVDGADRRLPSVTVDHAAAAAAAVDHLLRLGHRRIALIDHADDPLHRAAPAARRAGYRATLAAAGVEPRPDYQRPAAFTPEAGATAADALLSLPEPPTAVFAGSDAQALGVIDAARARGRRVPDDLAVVGYNDIEIAPFLGLTTVRVPMREMGRRAIDLLLAAIEDPGAPPAQVRLPVELVVRRTSGAAGRADAGPPDAPTSTAGVDRTPLGRRRGGDAGAAVC